jgi:hypothetical protein
VENPSEAPPCTRAHDEIPEWLLWCTREIRRQPLTALGIGATVGFILGGGTRSSVGRHLLVVASKSLVGGALGGLLAEAMKEHGRDGVRTSPRTEPGAR